MGIPPRMEEPKFIEFGRGQKIGVGIKITKIILIMVGVVFHSH